MRVGVVWLEAEGLLKPRDRLVELTFSNQYDTQVIVCFSEVGLKSDGLAKLADRLVKAPGLAQHEAQLVVCISGARAQPEDRLKLGDRLVKLLLLAEDDAQTVVCLSEIGLKTYSLLVMGDGVVGIPEGCQGITHFEVQVGSVGREASRGFELAEGLGTPLFSHGDAKVEMGQGIVPGNGQCAPEEGFTVRPIGDLPASNSGAAKEDRDRASAEENPLVPPATGQVVCAPSEHDARSDQRNIGITVGDGLRADLHQPNGRH